MVHFKFKPGQVLIGGDNEIVLIVDTYFDAHTYQKDYLVETIKPGTHYHRKIGQQTYLDKSISEAWFRLANKTEQVLYGR